MSKSGSESLSSSGFAAGTHRPAGSNQRQDSPMVDEMFDGMDVVDSVINEDSGAAASGSGASSSLLSELASNDRTVHADFQCDFGIDFFEDNDLN